MDCGDKTDNKTEMCKAEEFQCLEQHFCVHKSWTCDGDRDCPDGSDESQEVCKEGIECESDQFMCGDAQCIPQHLHCDGEDHCADQSDEKNCSEKVVQVKHDVYNNTDEVKDNVSNNTDEVKPDVSNNTDEVKPHVSNNTDEVKVSGCLSVPPVCSQTCISTSGGYKCSCLAGYVKVVQLVIITTNFSTVSGST